MIIQDKKCPPGVTFEDLKKAYEGGAGNIGSVCPKQPFGYGTGYCYFRNINPLLRTFEIDPEVSIVYYRHPYDFDTPREILGNIISLSSWVDLFNKGLYYTIETEPGKTEKKRNIYSYEDDEPFKIALVKNKVVKIEKLELQRE
ncbi:MAG: hypothetical protein KatS3mg093_018 [Candidatus Parcubacteria bacterium]|nr:MAG: hypothetical protein KatS3mg093_018 [Candidatus Parcubacteria bacterium]